MSDRDPNFSDYWKRLQKEEEERSRREDYSKQEYWNGIHDYGRGTSGDPNYGPIPEEYESNGMSRAAFACGVVSLIAILFGGSLFFGALGLVFALLSRKKKLSRQAKAALWMSAAGIAAFVLTLAISVWTLVSTGLWDRMIDRIRTMDPNDPYALTDLQAELLEDLLESYGLGISSVNDTSPANTQV